MALVSSPMEGPASCLPARRASWAASAVPGGAPASWSSRSRLSSPRRGRLRGLLRELWLRRPRSGRPPQRWQSRGACSCGVCGNGNPHPLQLPCSCRPWAIVAFKIACKSSRSCSYASTCTPGDGGLAGSNGNAQRGDIGFARSCPAGHRGDSPARWRAAARAACGRASSTASRHSAARAVGR